MKRLSFKSFFELLDINNNKLLSFEEFTSERFNRIVSLSPKVKEELFALMDKNNIGMVDYESFLEVLQITAVTKEKERVSDSFAWEEGVVKKLRNYARKEKLTPEETFKVFDRDFDGKINQNDLRWVLINILKIEPEEIITTKLQRLYKLLDFYKVGHIQLSDVTRLMDDENAYRMSGFFT